MITIHSTRVSNAVCLASAMLLFACGNSTSSESGTDAAADTSTADGASTDSGADSAQGPKPQMLLSSGQFGDGINVGNTNLLFKNYLAAPGERCAVTKQGVCYVSDCRVRDGGAPPHGVSAGTVTLSSPTGALLTITPFAADGLYSSQSLSTTPPPWVAGDTVTFAATGGDIPAFSVPPMIAPAVPVVLSPTPPDGGATFVLSRSAALTVTWQPVSGTVTVAFLESPPGIAPNDLRIVCEYDGMSGTATVAADVMKLFATGVASTFNVARAVTADVTPGGYPIHVFLWNAVTTPVVFQ